MKNKLIKDKQKREIIPIKFPICEVLNIIKL